MPLRVVNVLLLMLFLATVALNWAERAERDRPHVEILPEMVRSAAAESFSPNPVFADGKTLQKPAPGTIPRGLLPLHYQATPEDAHRAGEELTNPYSLNNENALKRGASVYANFCLACHGPTRAGDGPVARRGYPPPPAQPPPIKDGEMFHIITYGRGNMPSHAGQLSREDRWKVILYIRSLQQKTVAQAAGGKP
ncbi:MAG: cytochrome c [Acidobacteria bacterium]|nr:cytochrome c [Acidobacteriota bacterium]